MDIGSRLIVLLEEQELTQRQFAERLHINYNTANGYIRNRRLPDCETLLRMAECLDSSTDYITGRTTIRHHRDLGCSQDEGILLSNYRGLNTEMRQVLVEISTSLYKSQRNQKR